MIAAVAIYFLSFAWPGLYAGFTFDDVMNIYRAERLSYPGHAADIALFFRYSDAYRPLGSLFYRLIFEQFGFTPFPYRVAIYALLLVNLGLGYALASKLTGSRESAALTLVLFAYHGRYSSFFHNTGYVYDLLCFTFFTSAFLYYLTAYKPRLIIWCGLFLLAINSKEMAVSLPVLIAAWELLQPERRKRWWLIPALGAAMNVLFIVGRLATTDGLLGIPGYHPAFDLSMFCANAQAYLREVAYSSRWLSTTKMAALAIAAVFIAVLSRNATLRLALIWMTVGFLPIAFIYQRPLAAAYLPMFGLTLFLGGSVWQTSWALAKRIPGVTPQRWGVAAFAALLLVMTLVHRKHGRRWELVLPEHSLIARVYTEMLQWQPELSRGARLLVLSKPFPDRDWDTVFMAGIVVRQPELTHRIDVNSMIVHQREKLTYFFPSDRRLTFDLVLSQENGHLTACDPTRLTNLTVSELAAATCQPIVADASQHVRSSWKDVAVASQVTQQ